MYTADLAIVNANILTMDPDRPYAAAALVRGGRIRAVGSNEEVLDAGRDVPEFDCGGKTVTPGFIDGHCHLEMTCYAFEQSVFCHTPPLESLADIADSLRPAVAEAEPGRWIIGRGSFGLADKVREGKLFDRHDLDAVSTAHPIVVYAGFHVGMLNTMALKELGLWDKPLEPPRGVFLHVGEDGTPTGVVTEIWSLLPPPTLDETRQALSNRVRELFVANGVTSAYTIPYSANDVRAIQELQAEGRFPLRMRAYYHVPQQLELEDVLSTGLLSGFGNEMFRVGGVKIFVNGIHNDGMGNPAPDFKRDQEELNAFVTEAYQGGIQLMMHTIGVDAVRFGATAIEAATGSPPGPHRLRLEHAADAPLTEEDMDRLARAKIGLVATPQFLHSSSGHRGEGEPARTRLRTLIDRGFEVIGASDSTGTVPDGVSPMFNVACSVARQTRDGVVDPEESLTAEEGIKMFTLWAAKGGLEEHDKGSITVGKLGDFAVLSDDPREAAPDDLFQIGVDATILGGEVVHGG